MRSCLESLMAKNFFVEDPGFALNKRTPIDQSIR